VKRGVTNADEGPWQMISDERAQNRVEAIIVTGTKLMLYW